MRPSSVLLVEDSHDLAVMYATALEALGVELLVAEDGPSALAALERNSVDLALIDIDLPGIDGLEVLSSYRANPKNDSPIVMLTNSDDAQNRSRAKALGAVDYLLKVEVTPSALRRYVRARLATRDPATGSGFSTRSTSEGAAVA